MDKTTALTNVLNSLDQPMNLLRKFFTRTKLNGFITMRQSALVMDLDDIETTIDKNIGVSFENQVFCWTLEGSENEIQINKDFSPTSIYAAIKSIEALSDCKKFCMVICVEGFNAISQNSEWSGYWQPELQSNIVQSGTLADIVIEDINICLSTDGVFPKHMQKMRNRIFIFPADCKLGTYMREGNYSFEDHGKDHACFHSNMYIYVNIEQPILSLILPISVEQKQDDEFDISDFDNMDVDDVLIEIQTQDTDDDCEGGACKI